VNLVEMAVTTRVLHAEMTIGAAMLAQDTI
jgi:hypothetical protein